MLFHGGEEAKPGDGVAERAVYERLYLDTAAFYDGRNLGEAQFPCQNDTGETDFAHREDAFEVVGHELRGCVECEGRKILPCEPGDAEILHDEPVGAQLVE